MVTVTCPHCSAVLKMSKAPASGKVKCPKCGQAVSVAGPTAPVGDAASGGTFDFGQIDLPPASPAAGVTQFQTGGKPLAAFKGPAPNAKQEPSVKQEPGGAKQADKPNANTNEEPPTANPPAFTLSAPVVSSIALFAIVAIVAVMMLSWFGVGDGEIDPVAELQASAPPGYQAIGFNGCLILMPDGETDIRTGKLPKGMEGVFVTSASTGSGYFFGVMDDNPKMYIDMRLAARVQHQIGTPIGNTVQMERNGYGGSRIELGADNPFIPTGPTVPVSAIEAYMVDGRFVILGFSKGYSELAQELSAEDVELERKTFYDSFHVGPEPE